MRAQAKELFYGRFADAWRGRGFAGARGTAHVVLHCAWRAAGRAFARRRGHHPHWMRLLRTLLGPVKQVLQRRIDRAVGMMVSRRQRR